MGNCSVELDLNEYVHPKIKYNAWEKDKLDKVTSYIEKKLEASSLPTVIVMEIGHFTLPKEESNLTWAKQNIGFANEICKRVIQKYKYKYKIIPTLLINNFDCEQNSASDEIIDDMLKGKKYINHKSLKIISERNLKNRAFKALKNNTALMDNFINIDGKAYLKDDDYQHDLAAGFVNEDGDIIPRCGLILTSFLDIVTKLAKERLHQDENINVLFISFSEVFHEYKRVMLGADIYSRTHKEIMIEPMVFHWAYELDQCQLSHKPCDTKTWESVDL
jgi:hypothetical protein